MTHISFVKQKQPFKQHPAKLSNKYFVMLVPIQSSVLLILSFALKCICVFVEPAKHPNNIQQSFNNKYIVTLDLTVCSHASALISLSISNQHSNDIQQNSINKYIVAVNAITFCFLLKPPCCLFVMQMEGLGDGTFNQLIFCDTISNHLQK